MSIEDRPIDVTDGSAIQREWLGRVVRAAWVKWAREQPDPKPHWLLPWEALDEPGREVDRRIGETIWGLAKSEYEHSAYLDDKLIETIGRMAERHKSDAAEIERLRGELFEANRKLQTIASQ